MHKKIFCLLSIFLLTGCSFAGFGSFGGFSEFSSINSTESNSQSLEFVSTSENSSSEEESTSETTSSSESSCEESSSTLENNSSSSSSENSNIPHEFPHHYSFVYDVDKVTEIAGDGSFDHMSSVISDVRNFDLTNNTVKIIAGGETYNLHYFDEIEPIYIVVGARVVFMSLVTNEETTTLTKDAYLLSLECEINFIDGSHKTSENSLVFNRQEIMGSLPTSSELKNIEGYIYDIEVNGMKFTTRGCYKGGTADNPLVMLGTKTFEKALFANKEPFELGEITEIIFTAPQGSSANSDYCVYFSEEPILDPTDNDPMQMIYVTERDTTVTFINNNPRAKYFSISAINTGYNGQIGSIEICYK